MEFPKLGKHCSESTCKQLDFLPMKCDACDKTFCRDHIIYASHSCTESYKKDNQIPVCPLCNLPCPLKKGDSPDVVVGRHIESDCQSDPAKSRRKVFTNKCSKKGCKQKELVPVKCEICHLNFCLRHRHELDHNCQGFQGSGHGVSNSGAAALARAQQQNGTKPKRTASSSTASSQASRNNTRNPVSSSSGRVPQPSRNVSSLQGTLNEDEALARALQNSMAGNAGNSNSQLDGMTQQERDDFLLAQALAASEQEARVGHQASRPQRQEQRIVERCLVQ